MDGLIKEAKVLSTVLKALANGKTVAYGTPPVDGGYTTGLTKINTFSVVE